MTARRGRSRRRAVNLERKSSLLLVGEGPSSIGDGGDNMVKWGGSVANEEDGADREAAGDQGRSRDQGCPKLRGAFYGS